MNFLRFQNGQPPFNNVALRRAVASAVDQMVFTRALVSDNPKACAAMYPCFLPGINELGKDVVTGRKDFAAIARQVKEAGYDGTEIVILNPSDNTMTAPMGPLLLDMCNKIGIKAKLEQMDLATMAQRRISNAPLGQGGWSMFPFLTSTPVLASPATAVVARGLGERGWPGNNNDPQLEERIGEWIGAATEKEQLERLNAVHARLWETVPLVPLASYSQYTAYRNNLTGYIQSVVGIPWGIRRA
jgi:peptide/nickel transport system substrate-binding protein